ncbi:MAG: hypothetical protein MIO93_14940 [ANME-2 cluster archaeon]|jgi:hypothetical protein|nr:hypothetical protein [ANME-2 cluster archaeon]
MLKIIIVFLILFSIIHPVSALDPFITINVPVEEEPTKGLFLNPEHPSSTFQQGQNISIFNNDRNKRYFTVVCDRNIFDNGTNNTKYLRYRNRAYIQLNEPGIFNFHLLTKPTVTFQITVVGDATSTNVQETQVRPLDTPEKDELFPGMGELPAPGMLPAFIFLILAFLTVRTKK